MELLELVDDRDSTAIATAVCDGVTNENTSHQCDKSESSPSRGPVYIESGGTVPKESQMISAPSRAARSPRQQRRRTKSEGGGLLFGAGKSPSCRRSWRASQRTATTSTGGEVCPSASSSSPSHPHPGDVMKIVRQRSAKVTHVVGSALGNVLRSIEEFLFPRMTIDSGGLGESITVPRVLGGVLLKGCETAADHHTRVKQCLVLARDGHGEAGLRELGLEYRILPCEVHRPIVEDASFVGGNEDGDEASSGDNVVMAQTRLSMNPGLTSLSRDISDSMRSSTSVESVVDMAVSLPSPDDLDEADFDPATEAEFASGTALRCHLCMRRLYDVASESMITEENRNQYIADGEMYEVVARLCQEFAHDVMCQEGNMEWVDIEPQSNNGDKPPTIRAIINKDHPLVTGTNDNPMLSRPSLVIATGRGKVRAGIFSRHHLICSGLESATAVPIVREALRRRLNILIVDPNIHGESQGFVVFEQTMNFLASLSTTNSAGDAPLTACDLYVLSHSASGGHLARYLLDKSEHYLPHIRAIAFTDSTHNIQWAKTRNNDPLHALLESPRCVYFRSSKVRVEDQRQWYLHRAGEEVQTDTFWQHRFGRIRTVWAGTNEHSMTNWYAHAKIWEHFDSHLNGDSCKGPQGRPNAGRGASQEAKPSREVQSSTERELHKVMQL
jgi:hypothetical protein